MISKIIWNIRKKGGALGLLFAKRRGNYLLDYWGKILSQLIAIGENYFIIFPQSFANWRKFVSLVLSQSFANWRKLFYYFPQ